MDLDVIDFLQKAVSSGASDMFIIAGLPASIRINGNIVHLNDTKLLPADTENIILQIYNLAGNRNIETLELTGDDDFSFAVPGLSRFRVSAYKQRGSFSVVVRVITFELPDSKVLEMCIRDRITGAGSIAGMFSAFVFFASISTAPTVKSPPHPEGRCPSSITLLPPSILKSPRAQIAASAVDVD